MGLFGKLKDELSEGFFGRDPDTKVKQVGTLSPEQQQASKSLLSYLQGIGSPTADNVGFQGDRVAGPTNIENLSLSALEERSKQLSAGDPTYQNAINALNSILTRGPTDTQDFFRTNIQNPALEAFNEDIRPAISSRFADQFFGSARRSADQRATEDLLESLTASRESVALAGREQDTNAILQALGLTSSVVGGQTSEIQSILQSGQSARSLTNAELAAEYQDYVTSEQIRQERAKLIAEYLGIPQVENIVTGIPGRIGSAQVGREAFSGAFGEGAGQFLSFSAFG